VEPLGDALELAGDFMSVRTAAQRGIAAAKELSQKHRATLVKYGNFGGLRITAGDVLDIATLALPSFGVFAGMTLSDGGGQAAVFNKLRAIYNARRLAEEASPTQRRIREAGPNELTVAGNPDEFLRRVAQKSARLAAQEGDGGTLEAAKDEVTRWAEICVESPNLGVRGQDLLDYWNNEKRLPILRQLFLEIALIPATSCAVERTFSRAGLQFGKRRQRLLTTKLESLVVLSDNPDEFKRVLGLEEVDVPLVKQQMGALLEWGRAAVVSRDLAATAMEGEALESASATESDDDA
jgi:hypothetical protein